MRCPGRPSARSSSGACGAWRPSFPASFWSSRWGGVVGILTVPLFGVGVMIFGSVLTAYLVVAPNRPSANPRLTVPAKPVVLRWGSRGWAVALVGMLLALAVPNLLTNPGRPLHGALWPSLALVGAFWAVAGVGAVMAGAAWWGAVFNSYQLVDKTWFHRLRWTGILGALTLPLLGDPQRRVAPSGSQHAPPEKSAADGT